jgi:hypothetical protein
MSSASDSVIATVLHNHPTQPILITIDHARTDGEIRRALKQVEQTGKQLSLVDGDGHGTGRLVLVMKPMPTRVTADWMAQQWRDQKRLKKKLGSYPSMSLSKAREVFARDFADPIQKGRSIKIAGDTRPGTMADLFEAYVQYLKDAEKPSWKETEKGLNKIADTLGRNRPAREIEPDEIVEVIRAIYERGKKAMADHVRSYVRAAYSWGLKSEHDYRSASRRRFRLVYNRRWNSDGAQDGWDTVAQRGRIRSALPLA